MLEGLRQAFHKALNSVLFDEDTLNTFIKDLQRSLIVADVDVRLVFELSKRIRQRVKDEAHNYPDLRHAFVNVVVEELAAILGQKFDVSQLKPGKLMMVGLYGSGKTTSVAKLAYFLKQKGYSVGVVSYDFSRPAAQTQLEQLLADTGVVFYKERKYRKHDFLIIDTPGRNALDESLMAELKDVFEKEQPDDVWLVVSADVGKGAKQQLLAFGEHFPISHVVVTKFDGTGKAGGVLAILKASGASVSFLGVGEKLKDWQVFDPELVVKRLLGLPFFDKIDLSQFKQVSEKKDLDLNDFLAVMREMRSQGLSPLLNAFGVYNVPSEVLVKSEEEFKRMEAIIYSMTPYERAHPEVVLKQKTRLERIARGSGTTRSQVSQLIKKFKLFKKLKKQEKALMKNKSLLHKFLRKLRR
jgi:signal recognition particle subunit SRP54